jgi:hypothetical protein
VGKISARPEQGSDWNAVIDGKASLSEIYVHPVLRESVIGIGHLHDQLRGGV